MLGLADPRFTAFAMLHNRVYPPYTVNNKPHGWVSSSVGDALSTLADFTAAVSYFQVVQGAGSDVLPEPTSRRVLLCLRCRPLLLSVRAHGGASCF